MSRKTVANWIVVAVVAAAVPGCIVANRGDGLVQVNEFMTMVERVHTDSELAAQKVEETTEQFSHVLTFDFDKPAVSVYTEFAAAVDGDTKQLAQLHTSIEAMKKSADPVFKKWAADLDAFDSIEMRLKSQQRLLETRKRYDAILAAAEPAQAAYQAFDKRMRDYANFLSHDFNEASVAALRNDERLVKESAVALNGRFDACQLAAREYVQASAPPTAPVEPEPAAEKAPAKKPAKRTDG